MNLAILSGHVGGDPEIRTFDSGGKIATFSLATSRTWTDGRSGERREKTEWHRVVVKNEVLIDKIVVPYVKKGGRLGITGTIEYREFEKNGEKRYATDIVVSYQGTIELQGGRKDDASPAPAGETGKPPAAAAGKRSDLDDEIPF